MTERLKKRLLLGAAGLIGLAALSVIVLFTIGRDRVYRGFCRNESVVQAVRQHYLAVEPDVMGVLAQYQKDFLPRDYNDLKKFIEEFYAILKNNAEFKERIIDACRRK